MKYFFILIFIIIPILSFSQDIVINEIMSSNNITVQDEDGDASDWIELYNHGTEQANLSGCFLSDDSLEIDKWQCGDAVIEAGEHLIIFASDKDKFDRFWHTNFKISASGEEVVLSDSNGTIME